jgi:tungstate transport system substrate-binding protein
MNRLRMLRAICIIPALACLALLLPPGFIAMRAAEPPVLRLATTTSTADTGLLAAILPDFEKVCQCRVQVVAVGTGQAIEIGRRGDADVLLVHDRTAEEKFLSEGHAKTRTEVMSNDFVVVGPRGDPAGAGKSVRAADAFRSIARARLPFVSRGDRSGTNSRELLLWRAIGPEPAASDAWYQSVGQGMGETLVFANERGAYTLSDRATWLAMRSKLARLDVVVGGVRPAENPDPALMNMYAVMVVDAAAHPGVRQDLSNLFVTWLISPDTQRRIESFGVDRFSQPLFYGQADSMRVTREVTVRIGTKARTFTLAELRRMPREVLNDYTVLGVKRGKVGTFSFAGVSLAAVLREVDPAVAQASRSGARILVVSRDGWTSTLKWGELFGTLPAAAMSATASMVKAARRWASAPCLRLPVPRPGRSRR